MLIYYLVLNTSKNALKEIPHIVNRNAYQEFEKKAIQNIIEPLNEVLVSFSELSDTVSGEALRNFIITFKSKTEKVINFCILHLPIILLCLQIFHLRQSRYKFLAL